MKAVSSTSQPMRIAAVIVVGLAILAPSLLDSQRRGGGGSRGGGRASAGSSVRQSHAVSSPSSGNVSRSSSSRPSAPSRQGSATNADISQRTNVDNRRTNVDYRDITINNDVNIDNSRRDLDDVDNVHISGDEHNVWINEGNVHVYEDYDGWKVAAGVTAAIAVGTMLASPPPHYSTVYVGTAPYYYSDGAYYTEVYSGGEIAYEVVNPPIGAVVTTLPSGCVQKGPYWTCDNVYYQRSGSGYMVIENPF